MTTIKITSASDGILHLCDEKGRVIVTITCISDEQVDNLFFNPGQGETIIPSPHKEGVFEIIHEVE